MAGRNFLEVERNRNSFFDVVEEPDLADFDIDAPGPDFKAISPDPGLCVKVKTDDNEKVFINLCHCPEVTPPPQDLDVHKIIASENPEEESLFRFPLSLGELHVEKDKSGKECKCYDVVINSNYFEEVSKSETLRDFIVTLACSGLERKYDISFDIGTCTVLNKPYHGKMPKHFIRLRSNVHAGLAPVDKIIPDHDDVIMPVRDPVRLISSSGPEIFRYDLYQIPATGDPSCLIFQGLTKNVKDKKSLAVFVSKRKLTVRDTKCKSLISVALPCSVVPEKTLSNFWKNRLCIVMLVESN